MKSTRSFASCAWPIAACLLLLTDGLGLGCKRNETAATNPGQPTPHQAAGSGYFKTPFQNESQFVVENITTDIAEMVYFARNHHLPDAKVLSVDAEETGGTPDAPAYNVTVKLGTSSPVHTTVTVSGPIWSEEVYSKLTAAIAREVGLESPSSSQTNDTTMLAYLTDGLAATIEKQNLKLSEDLQKDFLNPALHEQAAALLGAFALRENSGQFYDIRLALCRMTAHLALARFLAGQNPPDLNGELANCMLLTLMNNQVPALDQLKKVDTKDRVAATWARVLQAYASRDFRSLTSAEVAPCVEQIAWFWAYSSVNSRGVAWDKAGEEVTRIPDYSRIAAAMGYSVQMGNIMLQSWLPLEYEEIGKVYQLSHGRDLEKKELVAALNEAPERCFKSGSKNAPQISVIGWGLWTLQLQHHLCQAIATDYNSLQRKLGVPDDARQFAEKCESEFGGLRFYAFVRRLVCADAASYRKSVDEGWAFWTEFPHLTPIKWPDYLCGRVSFAPLYLGGIPNPHCNEWTSHNPLPGTAYDADARLDFQSFTGGFGSGGREQVLKVHALAPYDIEICRYIGRTYYTTNWTYEAAMSTFGPLLLYSAVAGSCIADSLVSQPEQYEKTMEHVAELDPSFYYNLGDYEWKRGKTNEAVKVYEKAVEKDSDALHAANYAAFLIDHYLATGDKEKARATADSAGEVYSYRGLAAKAGYFEKTGDLPHALEWFDKIQERYGKSTESLSFCSRHVMATGDAALDKEIATRLKKWFDNQKQVKVADFQTPPTNGLVLLRELKNDATNNKALEKGDVLVAVRGIRVHNLEQLAIARDLDSASEVKVILWRNGSYRECNVSLSDGHRLGFEIGDYKPGVGSRK
jgi:tetratricopeptide (TPR) repeat protein